MSENLLRNGDFEGDVLPALADHLVFPVVDGVTHSPHGEQHENVSGPAGWRIWWLHDPRSPAEVAEGWAQPEAHLTSEQRRVSSGARAWQLFTFHARHTAGLFQIVDVPGHGPVTVWLRSSTRWPMKHNNVYWDNARLVLDDGLLALTAMAHAWSNAEIPGPGDLANCGDDGTCSTGIGRDGVAMLADELSGPTGDPWRDGLYNITFQVGIDPSGGRDVRAPGIVWSPGWHIYNAPAPISVLVRLDEPEPTQPPLPSPCRGLPREQYERTYVLLPPGASAAWATAVAEATWGAHRFTIGGSADDAGIGDLDARRVIAVNPDEWDGGAEALRMWFVVHYPGVAYVPVEAATPDELVEVLR